MGELWIVSTKKEVTNVYQSIIRLTSDDVLYIFFREKKKKKKRKQLLSLDHNSSDFHLMPEARSKFSCHRHIYLNICISIIMIGLVE